MFCLPDLALCFKVLFLSELQSPSNLTVVPGSVMHNGFTVVWTPVLGAQLYRISTAPPTSNLFLV